MATTTMDVHFPMLLEHSPCKLNTGWGNFFCELCPNLSMYGSKVYTRLLIAVFKIYSSRMQIPDIPANPIQWNWEGESSTYINLLRLKSTFATKNPSMLWTWG